MVFYVDIVTPLLPPFSRYCIFLSNGRNQPDGHSENSKYRLFSRVTLAGLLLLRIFSTGHMSMTPLGQFPTVWGNSSVRLYIFRRSLTINSEVIMQSLYLSHQLWPGLHRNRFDWVASYAFTRTKFGKINFSTDSVWRPIFCCFHGIGLRICIIRIIDTFINLQTLLIDFIYRSDNHLPDILVIDEFLYLW